MGPPGRLVGGDATRAAIRNVYDVREALDGLAGRLAALRADADQIRRLHVILDVMNGAVETERRDILLGANMTFHRVIYRAARNQVLAWALGDLEDYSLRFGPKALSRGRRDQETVDEHERILHALEQHDADGAANASASHIRAIRHSIVAS